MVRVRARKEELVTQIQHIMQVANGTYEACAGEEGSFAGQ